MRGFGGKTWRKEPLARLMHRGADSIKMDPKLAGQDGVDWVIVAVGYCDWWVIVAVGYCGWWEQVTNRRVP